MVAHIEFNAPLNRKLKIILASGLAGALKKTDRADSINQIKYDNSQKYRSYRDYPNPPLFKLENKMLDVIDQFRGSNLKINAVPWNSNKYSKGLHLAMMVAFSDQHQQPIAYDNFVPDDSREFVNRVMQLADDLNRQITIPEQFRIALDLSQGSILGAGVIAHAGSRSIARLSDTRVDKKFQYSMQEGLKWRDSVANFESITGDYFDPPGDTYHFWGTFIAGLLSEVIDNTKDQVLNPIYQQIYLNTAEITDFLRNKVSKIVRFFSNKDIVQETVITHKAADILGYHLSKMIGSRLLEGNDQQSLRRQ